MKIDYRGKFKAQLQENILKVRDEIDNPDFVFKITNHADKYDRDFNEVRSKILTDDFFAETFAKDPAKQNIYEKLAADLLKNISLILLSSSQKKLSGTIKIPPLQPCILLIATLYKSPTSYKSYKVLSLFLFLAKNGGFVTTNLPS